MRRPADRSAPAPGARRPPPKATPPGRARPQAAPARPVSLAGSARAGPRAECRRGRRRPDWTATRPPWPQQQHPRDQHGARSAARRTDHHREGSTGQATVPAWRPARHIEVDIAGHKRLQPPGRPHPRATPGPNGPRPVPAMPLTHPRTVGVSHLRGCFSNLLCAARAHARRTKPSPRAPTSRPIGTPNTRGLYGSRYEQHRDVGGADRAVPAHGTVLSTFTVLWTVSADGSQFLRAADRRAQDRHRVSQRHLGQAGDGMYPAAAVNASAVVGRAAGAETAARSRYGSSAWAATAAGARRGRRPARLPGTRPAAATAVDEQAVDGIRDGIQRRAHDGQATERSPIFGVEEHLEHHAPPVRMPRPVADPVGQCRLDQGRVMLFLPPEGRNLTVQDLDRPPLGHNRDGTLRPRTATPACLAQAATRRDPSRPPSPNGQPGNVSPKPTRKLSTRTHARSPTRPVTWMCVRCRVLAHNYHVGDGCLCRLSWPWVRRGGRPRRRGPRPGPGSRVRRWGRYRTRPRP